MTQFEVPDGQINFGIGQPELALLPREPLERATAAALRGGTGEPAAFLTYGAQCGAASVRETVAGFLSQNGYQSHVDPASLLMTNGNSQAMDLVAQLFEPGDVVLVEEPTYFLALQVFRDHGLKTVAVPVDPEGVVDLVALDALAQEHRPKLLYTIPVFHNPTGATLSLADKQELCQLARKHEFLVLADEVYQLLWFAGKQPPSPPLYHVFCSSGPRTERAGVVSIGSFSKILGPGLRLGWIQSHPDIVERLSKRGFLTSGGGLAPFVGEVVRHLIDLGEQRQYLESLRRVYGQRCATLCRALQTYLCPLDTRVRFAEPDGGYFVWVYVPWDTSELDKVARARYNVGFNPGHRFSVDGKNGDCNRWLRLCFAHYPDAVLEEGVRRLSHALLELLRRQE